MIRNAGRHVPNAWSSPTTSNGATAAPIDDPLSKSATAQPLSRRGNHSATALVAPGQLPASPGAEQETEEAEGPQAGRERRQHRGDRVERDRHASARCACRRASRNRPAPAWPIVYATRNEMITSAKSALVQLVLILQRRAEDAERLPIDVVDDGGEKEQGADPPSETAGGTTVGHRESQSRIPDPESRALPSRSASAPIPRWRRRPDRRLRVWRRNARGMRCRRSRRAPPTGSASPASRAAAARRSRAATASSPARPTIGLARRRAVRAGVRDRERSQPAGTAASTVGRRHHPVPSRASQARRPRQGCSGRYESRPGLRSPGRCGP